MKQASALTIASIDVLRSRLALRGIATNTIRAYISDLRLFLSGSRVNEIPEETYEETAALWLQIERARTPPKTLLRRMTSIRCFARVMFGIEVLVDYRGPKSAPGSPHPIPEGMIAVDAMIECATKLEHKALIALCGRMGCRIQEALDITADDFDLRANVLRIRGKGDVTRFVPISEKAWAILAQPTVLAMASRTPLVTLHERYARKIITDTAARVRLLNEEGDLVPLKRHVSSHDLRATFATAIYDESNRNIRLVQILLGHRLVTTTQIYVGVDATALQTAVNSI
jgi:site-specific recombinase XerD